MLPCQPLLILGYDCMHSANLWSQIELIIRTSTLLLAVEEAAVKYVAHSGKDIIIASI